MAGSVMELETMNRTDEVSELPKGWQVLPIEDCLNPINGKKVLSQGWSPQCEKEPSPSEKEWGVLKTTAIQAGQFLQDENKRLPEKLEARPQIEVKAGDLLTTCAGPRSRCGVTCLVRETRPRLMISGKMYRYRAKEGFADPQYLEAYMQTQEAWDAIDKMKTGGSDSGLNLTHERFLQLSIPLAPLPEQRRIVAAIELQLGRLDAAVARLHAAKAKLKRYRQAVLKAAYDDSLSETDGVTSSLDEICSKITDGEHLRPKTVSEGVPFLSAKDIRDDDVSFADPLFVPEADAAKYRKRCDPVRGDILIVSRGATVGRMCIVRTDEVFCLLGSVILLKVQAGVDSQYVSWMIKSPVIQQQLTSLSGSTAQQAIYLKDIRKVELPLPSREMQVRLALEIRERYSAIDEMETTLDAQLTQSTRLRQAVLKRAFEGRLG